MASRLALACGGLLAALGISIAQPPAGSGFVDPKGDDWRLGIRMKSNADKRGVTIIEIIKGSPAESSGLLMTNDVLHSVDGKLFHDPLAVREDIMGSSRKHITLVWQRGTEFLEHSFELKDVEIVAVATTALADVQVQRNIGGKPTIVLEKQLVPVQKNIYVPKKIQAMPGKPKVVTNPYVKAGPKVVGDPYKKK